MKHEQAVEYLRQTLWAVQKVRSNWDELANGDEIMKRVEMDLFPKIADEVWLLNPLLKIIDRVDSGGKVEPMEFYNIMSIVDKWAFDPINTALILNTNKVDTLPEPDINWLRGWTE